METDPSDDDDDEVIDLETVKEEQQDVEYSTSDAFDEQEPRADDSMEECSSAINQRSFRTVDSDDTNQNQSHHKQEQVRLGLWVNIIQTRQ